MKVFVGLSGGVDSAVSAALLQKAGYDVTSVFIRIALPGYPCSAGEDKIAAQRVAAHLKIPFIEIDLSKEYKDEVFAYTLSELAKGRTPNPDTLCNQKIKFGAFYNYACAQGADVVATGHYARVSQGSTLTLMSRSNLGGFLYKGVDTEKDQSYFLWMVPQEVLAHTLFPIGHLRKPEVRELARKFNLPNAARPDSQGLCFLGDISLEEMIMRELRPKPGDVLDETGKVIGKHNGVALYTIGQRHGFELFASIGAPGVDTLPHFVIAKNTEANTITVSGQRLPSEASLTNLTLVNTNWIGALKSGSYEARFRYRQKLIPAKVSVQEGESRITLLEGHYIPEGQSLVLYKDQQCLGGGVVEDTELC